MSLACMETCLGPIDFAFVIRAFVVEPRYRSSWNKRALWFSALKHSVVDVLTTMIWRSSSTWLQMHYGLAVREVLWRKCFANAVQNCIGGERVSKALLALNVVFKAPYFEHMPSLCRAQKVSKWRLVIDVAISAQYVNIRQASFLAVQIGRRKNEIN